MKSDFPRQITGLRPQVIEAACRDRRVADDAGCGQGGRSPSRLDKTADDLRRDLSEIDVMLREALPRSAIEALEGELRKLADQVNGMGHAAVDVAALLPIERKLAEMRDVVRVLIPTESLFGLRQALQQLSHKLERIGGSSRHSPALGRIASVLAGLRGIGSRVATSPVLARLSDDIRCLAGSIELTSKLIEKISATDAALARLEAIEHKVASLDLECRRTPSLARPTTAEMDALAREVGDLRQAQKQTQDSLVAVRSSLEHVTDRLATIETEMRRSSPRSASDLPAVAPAAAAILPLAAEAGEGATPEPGGAAASGPQTPASGEHASLERHSVEASLSADPPPASGPGLLCSRTPSSPADRVLGSETTSAATGAPIASGSKLDFIAAARRAVQATADRQATAKNPVSTPAEATSADTDPARRVRMWGALIGAIAVVLVLFGGLQIARTLRSSAAEGGVAAPGPTVATQRPTPPAPPAAAVTQRRLSAIEQLTPDLATPQPAQ
jgi:localization factor PodJL